MQTIIERKSANGLHTVAYDVRMKSGNEYRRAEMILPTDADPQAAAAQQMTSLWENGAPVDVSWFIAARERQYIEYYKAVQVAMQATLAAGGNLAAINAAGLQALAADDAKLAEWQAYLAATGATSDYEIHLALTTFTLLGRQAAGG